jgi:FkbM family methyltransferase
MRRPCDLALDIGGNIGWYSGYFLALGCKLISIEARDFMASILNTTVYLNLNHEGIRAEVWNRAVASDSVGKTSMKDFRVMAGAEDKSAVRVQKASILDIFEKSHVIADLKMRKKVIDISMIKIDIEGSEMHVLKSLSILLKTNHFHFSNIFVELKPESWSQISGFEFEEASEIFDVFFDAGFCLRKLLYSECCKGVYKTKIDHACCKGSSKTLWPNWNKFRDVPDDIFGDIFTAASQMKPYFDNPNLGSTRTDKKALDGDFFLSKSEICTHGILSYPDV